MGDVYLVKLPNGDVRAMSHAELDDAFERGLIGERTPILPPGSHVWTTSAKLGGFDTDEFQPVPAPTGSHAFSGHGNVDQPSLSPMSFVPTAPPSHPSTPYLAVARRPSSILMAAIGVGVAVAVVGLLVSIEMLQLGTRAPSRVAAVSPPPPAVTAPAPEASPAKAAETPPAVAVSALPARTDTPKTTKKTPAHRSR